MRKHDISTILNFYVDETALTLTLHGDEGNSFSTTRLDVWVMKELRTKFGVVGNAAAGVPSSQEFGR